MERPTREYLGELFEGIRTRDPNSLFTRTEMEFLLGEIEALNEEIRSLKTIRVLSGIESIVFDVRDCSVFDVRDCSVTGEDNGDRA